MSTTPQHAPTAVEITKLLEACMTSCADGLHGFETAAADVDDPELRATLTRYAEQRARFLGELEALAASYGMAHVDRRGSARARAHRAWMGARRALAADRSDAMLRECVRGDVEALHAYEAALEKTPLRSLDAGLRKVIQGQYAAIRDAVVALDHYLPRDVETP